MRRRCLLLGLLALPAGAALAQEAPAPAAAAPAPAPAAPPRRPRRRLRRVEEPISTLGPEPRPAPPPQLDAAPVPNRDIEAPRTIVREEPQLSPTVIHRRLPGRGQATEGSYHAREERLFTPGPGARLSVPFSY